MIYYAVAAAVAIVVVAAVAFPFAPELISVNSPLTTAGCPHPDRMYFHPGRWSC